MGRIGTTKRQTKGIDPSPPPAIPSGARQKLFPAIFILKISLYKKQLLKDI
jgi:hypothetical protein